MSHNGLMELQQGFRNRAITVALQDIDRLRGNQTAGYENAKERRTLLADLIDNHDLQFNVSGVRGGIKKLTVEKLNEYLRSTIQKHPRADSEKTVTHLWKKGSTAIAGKYLERIGYPNDGGPAPAKQTSLQDEEVVKQPRHNGKRPAQSDESRQSAKFPDVPSVATATPQNDGGQDAEPSSRKKQQCSELGPETPPSAAKSDIPVIDLDPEPS